MITWKYKFLLALWNVNELLNNIKSTIFLQNILPKIWCRITVRVGRVAFSAVISCAITSLIERQEICLCSCKLRCHAHIGLVCAEVSKNTFVELEAYLTGVSIIHPLTLSVINSLSGVLVFEFKSEYWNTVYNKHHINRVAIAAWITPLPNAVADVLLIIELSGLVKMAFGFKITNAESHSPVLETVAQNGYQPILITGIIECIYKLFNSIAVLLLFKPLPLLWLSSFNKGNKSICI